MAIDKKKVQRVCFLNPQGYVEKVPPLGKTDTGGQTVYVLELARALGRQGIKVDIITRQFENRPQFEDIGVNVRIIRIPCGPPEFVVKEKMFEIIPEFIRNLVEFIENEHLTYDIIHSHYWDGGYAGIKLAKKLKIPHVFTPHSLGKWKQVDMQVDQVPVANLRKLYRYQVRIAAEQKIMDRANMIMMISEAQRIKLLQHYLVDFEKIQVIYPGIDIRYFNQDEEGLNVPEMKNKNRVLLVSRFVPAKGIDRAIEIFGLVTKKIESTLYIVTSRGEGMSDEEIENEKKIKEVIAKNKLSDRVKFFGFIPDRKKLAGYYKKADVFILPSRYEPFGLTTVESMACGTVTLVSNVAGSRELIIDGVNGFIVDMHERARVAKLIISIFNDKKLKKLVSDNAALTVKKHYSWDVICKKIIAAYTSVLA